VISVPAPFLSPESVAAFGLPSSLISVFQALLQEFSFLVTLKHLRGKLSFINLELLVGKALQKLEKKEELMQDSKQRFFFQL